MCKGGFPCVESADDTCTAANNTCLTAEGSDLYCLGGEKLSCPEGYECGEPIGPGLAPCRPRPPSNTEVCWSGADDYTCLDSESYCLVRAACRVGVAQSEAAGRPFAVAGLKPRPFRRPHRPLTPRLPPSPPSFSP